MGLLEQMETPGLEVGPLFRRVAATVNATTDGKQTPELSISLLGEFYFKQTPGPAPAADAPASGPAPAATASRANASAQAEIVFWQSVTENPTRESYEAYLESYPSGQFAALARARIAALTRPEPVPVAPSVSGDGFIFPDSDRRRLMGHDLRGLSKAQLLIARNEIYARKGRFFKSHDLQVHFGQFSWYKPYTWNPSLNAVERANVQMIQRFE
jgi:hypothetical protein